MYNTAKSLKHARVFPISPKFISSKQNDPTPNIASSLRLSFFKYHIPSMIEPSPVFFMKNLGLVVKLNATVEKMKTIDNPCYD
jgi:hypothetical protein